MVQNRIVCVLRELGVLKIFIIQNKNRVQKNKEKFEKRDV